MRKYLKGKWPEEIVPRDAPAWLHYEVDIDTDDVLRTIDVYASGLILRNSLSLAARPPFGSSSLVEGPFLQHASEWHLQEITEVEFNRLWSQGVDQLSP